METPLTIPPHAASATSKRGGAGAKILLVILILLLGFLSFLYWLLTKPPMPEVAPETKGIESVFSIYGISKDDTMISPNAVAFDKSGNIYVTDTGNERILVFNRRGNFKFKIEHMPKPKEYVSDNMYTPLGVAIGKDGRIYATSIVSGLFIFESNGKFEKHVPIPSAVQVYTKDDKVYVTTKEALFVLDYKGEILQHIGKKGRALGEFEYPNDVVVDAEGNIIVSDTQNMRIQKLDSKGKPISYMGTPPKSLDDSDRLFGLGTGMTIDGDGRIYIADAFHHAIRVFNKDGDDLGEYGEQGAGEGQFNYPSDIAYLSGNTFAVADKWNDRVQIVRLNAESDGGIISRAEGFPVATVGVLLAILLAVAAYLLRRYLQARKKLSETQKNSENNLTT